MGNGLVLKRKVGEAVVIDRGRIVIRVVQIAGGRVRLAITADRTTLVDREEIHEKRVAGGTI